MVKNRQNTEEKILQSVDFIIHQQGFHKLGINAVAKESGVSKILIYRYFGDFQGLLKSYAEGYGYWNEFSEELNVENDDFLKYSQNLLVGQFDHLMNNRGIIEILKWQLLEKNELTKTIDIKKENARFLSDAKLNVLNPEDADVFELFSTLMTSGLYYLAMRSSLTNVNKLVEFNDDDSKEKIRDGIRKITELVYNGLNEGGK